jgi:hypothetical protein
MKKQSERVRVVTEALLNFPKSSKNTIAEVVYQNNKLLFTDKEDARTAVRYCTGTQGKTIPPKIIEHKTNFTTVNPFGLPPTEANHLNLIFYQRHQTTYFFYPIYICLTMILTRSH